MISLQVLNKQYTSLVYSQALHLNVFLILFEQFPKMI